MKKPLGDMRNGLRTKMKNQCRGEMDRNIVTSLRKSEFWAKGKKSAKGNEKQFGKPERENRASGPYGKQL